jgi:hypothetical protein
MAIQDALSKKTGFSPPEELSHLVAEFEKKTGNFADALELLGDYLGLFFCDSMDCRGYESTPIEFFPFLQSGGDGEMYGYVIHAPEIHGKDYPLANFIPGDNDGVIHVGNSTVAAFENLISYAHTESEFADIDLPWLATLNIKPDATKADQVRLFIDEECVRPIPSIPPDYKHVMTSDGIGVVAQASQFGEQKLRAWTDEDGLEDFIAEADAAMRAEAWGAVLHTLKEAWWLKYWDAQQAGKQRKMKDRLVTAYGKLGKNLLAETMKSAFDWVK